MSVFFRSKKFLFFGGSLLEADHIPLVHWVALLPRDVAFDDYMKLLQ